MRLNAIGLGAACSLVCVAICQPAEARTIRTDQNQNGWTVKASPFTSSPYSVNPGATTPFTAAIGNNSPTMLKDDALLAGTSAVEYNWYASPTSFYQALHQAPALDQIVVFKLANDSLTEGSKTVNLNGDTEIEFNYATSSLTPAQLSQKAQFTIGGVTYSATVADIVSQGNDFVFSKSGAFVGSIDETTDSFGNVISANLSSSLDGWTTSGSVAAPEIDPSSTVTALTLLAGLLSIIRGGTAFRARSALRG